jgi:uncharacterized Ntn-hydrolase superfamily protein
MPACIHNAPSIDEADLRRLEPLMIRVTACVEWRTARHGRIGLRAPVSSLTVAYFLCYKQPPFVPWGALLEVPTHMTWSIIARDASGALGIAIASRFFAVGALCPYVRSGVGAVATQALANPLYGGAALDLLAKGMAPAQVVEQLTSADEGRDQRQLHMIAQDGTSAAFTGASCVSWCGHTSGENFSVAGNMLAGPQVIAETAAAWRANPELPFGERLIAALAAGEAAGGDKRGKQAAALLVHTTEDYAAIDIRVDDHVEPIQELRRLYEKSLERYQPFVTCLPSRGRPAGITDRALIEAEVERFQARRRGARP